MFLLGTRCPVGVAYMAYRYARCFLPCRCVRWHGLPGTELVDADCICGITYCLVGLGVTWDTVVRCIFLVVIQISCWLRLDARRGLPGTQLLDA